MSSWLGIAIAVVFSLALSLFMRLEPNRKKRPLPTDLGLWLRVEAATPDAVAPDAATETYLERRVLLIEGTVLRPSRLIEQRRRRNVADGRIVEILAERTLQRWRSW